MKSSFLFRTRIVYFAIVFFAFLLVSKLFLVQVIKADFYKEKADRQYSTPAGNMFERGSIFFEDKNKKLVSAATQATFFKVAINPEKIKDPESVFLKINEIIPLSREDFLAKSEKKNDPYEEIADRISKDEADKISALKIQGVSIYKDKWRMYPGGQLASQSLGFVAYEKTERAGRYGLERYYEKILNRDGETPYVNFFAEIFSNINNAVFNQDSGRGDIVTSIEPSVQSVLEKTLQGVESRYSPSLVGGIIMDPKTGALYAISSKPDFDPNNFSKIKNPKIFSNPSVENVFEFGSVIKPLVMASAIDLKLVSASTKYEDKGSVVVEKKEIFNFDKKARGQATMQDVLNQSLNTGMVFVYKKMGKENLRKYFLSFGIDEKTGIDLPNETKGLVSNIKTSPREIEYANASFGQGVALTPVGLIRALSALANGGVMPTPHLALRVRHDSGLQKDLVWNQKNSAISQETSMEITRMLVNVMDQSVSAGKKTGLERYSVAVKTGTAQVADNESGGYLKDKHMHSFFGYFPAYDPRFIILLYAVDPKGVQYAVQTWSNPFFDLAKFLINYYEIPPDR